MYIGIDLSTQKLKGFLLDDELHIQDFFEVDFDKDLPRFGTKNGILSKKPNDIINCNEVRCPTLLWVAALDALLLKMKQKQVLFSKVKGISGCAQQHGSVYWHQGWLNLTNFDPINDLQTICQCGHSFAFKLSPVWLDSSTGPECLTIRMAMAKCYMKKLENSPFKSLTLTDQELEALGDCLISQATGSHVIERFTLSQILRIFNEDNKGFQATERISLISSFVASLFLQVAYAPVDYGDGSGTNLMNLMEKQWDFNILQALCSIKNTEDSCFGAELKPKLGLFEENEAARFNYETYYANKPPNAMNLVNQNHLNQGLPSLIPTPTILGPIGPYFVQRYGFSPTCQICAFTGDNLGSLIGSRAGPKDLVISLGTSDTIFFWQHIDAKRSFEGNNDSLLPKNIDYSCNENISDDCIRNTSDQSHLKTSFSVSPTHVSSTNSSRRLSCMTRTTAIESAHLFANPISPFDNYMSMVVYKNGSLTRERLVEQNILARDAGNFDQPHNNSPKNNSNVSPILIHKDASERQKIIDMFNAQIVKTAPGNEGNIGFYYFEPEITPRVTDAKFPLIYRFNRNDSLIHLPNHDTNLISEPSKRAKSFLYSQSGPFGVMTPHVSTKNASSDHDLSFSRDIRALIEGRFLAMRNHVEALMTRINEKYRGGNTEYKEPIVRLKFNRILVTGGAASNLNIIKIMADIFGLPVCALTQQKVPNSLSYEDRKEVKIVTETAALGSGYLAKFALEIQKYVLNQLSSTSKSDCDHSQTNLNTNKIPFLQIFNDMTINLEAPTVICEPRLQLTRDIYDPLALRYDTLETRLIDSLFKL